jgi:hypothetical protein
MKPKHLFLAIAALLAASGVWFIAFHKSSTGKMPHGQALAPSSIRDDSRRLSGPEAGRENSNPSKANPSQMLRPPDPIRKFWELTPEQRVKLARQGPIGG